MNTIEHSNRLMLTMLNQFASNRGLASAEMLRAASNASSVQEVVSVLEQIHADMMRRDEGFNEQFVKATERI